MSTIKKIGEFGWIKLAEKFCSGIGDDAAVLPAGNKDLLVTTDMLLEGKHFRLGEASAFEIGRKAMAVNLSDIAAMGGTPRAAVVSLGVPAGTRISFLNELYRGMNAVARPFGTRLVGGDTNASPRWVVSIALLGDAVKGKAVRRSGAKAGDVLFVSGTLGGSYASKKHLRFTPRLREAQWLVKNFRVRAMMDLSDGLASDIRRICEQSGAGAALDPYAIPRSRGVSMKQALTDGEDFELLFALSPIDAARLSKTKAPKGFPKFTEVGEVVPKRFGIRLGGQALSVKGYDHFQ